MGEIKFSRAERFEFVKTLIINIGVNAEHWANPEQLRELHTHLRAKKITRVNKLLGYILRWMEPIRSMWNYGEKSEWFKTKGRESYHPKPTDHKAKEEPSKVRRDKPKRSKHTGESKADLRAECKGCGRKGHKRDACHGKEHPDYNKAECAWKDSDAIKAIRANQFKDEKGNPVTVLPWHRRADGTPYAGAPEEAENQG